MNKVTSILFLGFILLAVACSDPVPKSNSALTYGKLEGEKFEELTKYDVRAHYFSIDIEKLNEWNSINMASSETMEFGFKMRLKMGASLLEIIIDKINSFSSNENYTSYMNQHLNLDSRRKYANDPLSFAIKTADLAAVEGNFTIKKLVNFAILYKYAKREITKEEYNSEVFYDRIKDDTELLTEYGFYILLRAIEFSKLADLIAESTLLTTLPHDNIFAFEKSKVGVVVFYKMKYAQIGSIFVFPNENIEKAKTLSIADARIMNFESFSLYSNAE
ncbi:hypothetical protein AB6T38_07970 [Aliiglaciecola sp. SL4]|uniref:hypothetical protein n=1 Tax=Aliiglaciecola sp. SL4 TaxID=3239806 RepID=UPI00355C6E97